MPCSGIPARITNTSIAFANTTERCHGYQERQGKGEEQKQLSKEFVRRWLIENGFQGKEGQTIPEMTNEYIETVSERYIELYENIIGEKFVKADITNINERIENNVLEYLKG